MDFRQYKLVPEEGQEEEVEFSGEVFCESKLGDKFSVPVRDVRDGSLLPVPIKKGEKEYVVLRSVGRRYEAEQILKASNRQKGPKYFPKNEYQESVRRRKK